MFCIFSGFCQHVFRVINGGDFMAHLCQQYREKSRSAANIQYAYTVLSSQCLCDMFFPVDPALAFQLFPVTLCVTFCPAVPIAADLFQCMTHSFSLRSFCGYHHTGLLKLLQASRGDIFCQFLNLSHWTITACPRQFFMLCIPNRMFPVDIPGRSCCDPLSDPEGMPYTCSSKKTAQYKCSRNNQDHITEQ